jgi:hypothetical protein
MEMDYILKENIPDCHEDSICGSFTDLEKAKAAMEESQNGADYEIEGDECWVTSDDGKSVYLLQKTDAIALEPYRHGIDWHQDMIGVSSVSYSIIVCPRNVKGYY